MASIRFSRRTPAMLVLAAALAGVLPPGASAQVSGLVNTSATRLLSGQVNPGASVLDIPVPVSALTSLRLQAVVPVAGATLTLLDPLGRVVVAPSDPALAFLDGRGLSPVLPGGIYITPEVSNPTAGDWLLRLQFPPAANKTVVLVTAYAASPYQAGLVLTGRTFRVGTPVPLGMLVLNGDAPIGGLQPTLTLSKNGQPLLNLTLADSGQAADYDGRAGDGIYSKGFIFNDVGRYAVDATVTIPAAGGNVVRTASGVVDIEPTNYALGSVVGSVTTGVGGCVAALNMTASATALLPGIYSLASTLRSPDGTTLVKRANTTLGAAGSFNTVVSYTSREIRSRFSVGGVFTIDPIDVISVANDLVTFEAHRPAAYAFQNLAMSQFCAEPIDIGVSASVSATAREQFVGQLDFKLPMTVTTAGTYTVSFKVTDAQRNEVGQFAVSQYLAANAVNQIQATVLANRLQTADGPFNVESVLVSGAGRTAQASLIPVADSGYSRWQFYPTITGDLNGDRSVDALDRDLLLSMRNARPLVPGDRRDLNRDGKIDLLDARLLVLGACRAPNCPTN